MRAALAALALVVVLAGCGGGGDEGGEAAPTTAAAATTEAAAESEPEGELIFKQNCSGCHTLDAAGTTGKVGPNLDETQPSVERVRTMVVNGGGGGLGVMPAFKGSLSDDQIETVSRYVAESAAG